MIPSTSRAQKPHSTQPGIRLGRRWKTMSTATPSGCASPTSSWVSSQSLRMRRI